MTKTTRLQAETLRGGTVRLRYQVAQLKQARVVLSATRGSICMETKKPNTDKTSPAPPAWTSSFFWTVPPALPTEKDSRESIECPCPTHTNVTGVLAEVIRRRRLSLGISQQTLAELTGLDRGYIISIEQARRNPSISTLVQIAIGLKINASELLRQTEQEIADND